MNDTIEPAAIYFDGQSSRKRIVAVQLAEHLMIAEDGVVVASWPFGDIRRADGPADRLRLMCISAPPLARLEIASQDLQQIVIAKCPSLDLREGRQTGRIVGWSLAAAASIVLLVMYGIPFAAERLAPLVPRSVEARIGDVANRQISFMFGNRMCTDSAGQAALRTLVGKLTVAGGLSQPLEAQVVSSPLPNAFALPGGRIYLLDGLLARAENVDEVAGVLAHEMGHVEHRDSLRTIIKNGGTSYLVGLLFGDVYGGSAAVFATRSLFNSAYSRDVERDADAFAVSTMRALGRSPKPMAELLVRITGAKVAGGFDILASHPLTQERLATMSREDRPNSGPPLLTEAEWKALRSICRFGAGKSSRVR